MSGRGWNPHGWAKVKRRYSIFQKKEKKLPFINHLESSPRQEAAAVEFKQPRANKLVEFYYNLLAGASFTVLIVILLAIEVMIVWAGASVQSGEWALSKSVGSYLLGFFLGNIMAVIISTLSYVGINWLLKKIIKLITSRRVSATI